MKLVKVFRELQVLNDDGGERVLLGQQYHDDAVIGKHSIWLPTSQMKFMWSRHGKVEAFRDWDKGRNQAALLNGSFNDHSNWELATIRSFISELLIMEELAKYQMAPKIDGVVYARNVISEYLYGVPNCDPKGIYGYYLEDAKQLHPGKFVLEDALQILQNFGVKKPSEGAIGDLVKDDNIINGYLIDIRRTIWDMITLDRPMDDIITIWERDIEFTQDLEAVKSKVLAGGQFPFKQRKTNYQSYWLYGKYQEGSRDTMYRYDKMGLPGDLTGLSVVDLGCQIGSMCIEAKRRGAWQVTGIDNQPEFIDCARDIARVNGMGINFMSGDLTQEDFIVDYINTLHVGGPDVLFALALHKHIEDVKYRILNRIPWRVCYTESHNAPEGLENPHVKKLVAGLQTIEGAEITYLGQVADRSPRCIWRLDRGNS